MPDARLQRTREAYADRCCADIDADYQWTASSAHAATAASFTFSAPARFDTDSDPGDETENLWGV